MEKALKMGKVSATGSFQLFVGVATSSVLMAVATTYVSVNFLNTVEWLRLISGGIIFLTVYIIVAPYIGAILQGDISNLRAMLSGLGFISTMTNLPLGVAEKVAGISSARKSENIK